jgi:polysaccharide export outer membrane protein
VKVSAASGCLLCGALAVALGSYGTRMTHAQSASVTPSQKNPTKDKQVSINTASVPENEKNVYRIGVEDELQISVWREAELSTVAVVRPDGKITVPLLNDVEVVGLRPDELQTLLAEKLKPFVNEPQVTVIARNIRSRKVSVVGQISHQGSFPLNGNLTVLELVANAGGLTPFAKKSSIYVLRVENGEKKRIPFDYKKALSGKGQNILLQPGDIVVVP